MRLAAAVSAAAAPAKARVKSRIRISSRKSALRALPLSVDEDQRSIALERPILRGTRRRSRGQGSTALGRDRTPPYGPGSFVVSRSIGVFPWVAEGWPFSPLANRRIVSFLRRAGPANSPWLRG